MNNMDDTHDLRALAERIASQDIITFSGDDQPEYQELAALVNSYQLAAREILKGTAKMSHYTFQITKAITVTVEAGSKQEARENILGDIENGEYSYSFDKAEPVMTLIDQEG